MAKDKKEIKKDILNMFRTLENEDSDVLPSELLGGVSPKKWTQS